MKKEVYFCDGLDGLPCKEYTVVENSNFRICMLCKKKFCTNCIIFHLEAKHQEEISQLEEVEWRYNSEEYQKQVSKNNKERYGDDAHIIPLSEEKEIDGTKFRKVLIEIIYEDMEFENKFSEGWLDITNKSVDINTLREKAIMNELRKLPMNLM